MISAVPLTSLSAWRAAGFPEPSIPFLIKTMQAADAEEMDRVVLRARTEVAALSAAIVAATGNPDTALEIVDFNLAGAGDGHTFLFTLTYVAVALKGGSLGNVSQTLVFASASDGESLDKVLNQKLNATLETIITDPQNPEEVVASWNQVVGAAKSQRVMAGLLLLGQGSGV